MPLPSSLSMSNTFGHLVNATNQIITALGNTSEYILVSQSASPAASSGNVAINGVLTVGNSTVYITSNSTFYTGTSSNALSLNGQLASYYTNASNLATGTVPLARLSSANTTANGVVDTTTQSFAGNKTFTGTVDVTGAVVFSNTLAVTGVVTTSNTVTVTGFVNALSTLAVTGAASLSNTLAVTGAATFSSTLGVTANDPTITLTDSGGTPARTFSIRSADGTLIFRDETGGADRIVLATGGAVTVSGTLAVTGATTANGLTITAGSGLTANGAVGTSGQILTSNGSSPYWATSSAASIGDILALAIALG